MIYFVNAAGAVARCVPERVFQGSAEGSRIVLVAPFAQSEAVSVSFRLPDGSATPPYLLGFEGAFSAEDEEGSRLYAWSLLLPASVTADFGTVTAQFHCGSGLASEAVPFTVERGVRRELPEAPPDGAYADVLSALAALQQDLQSGYFASRAMYAYNPARTYGKNELAFVADAGVRGAIVRSLCEDNDTAPYAADGTLASACWAEAVRFDDLYSVEENAASYASAASSHASAAAEDAESAQGAAASARESASSASGSASSAQESASSAQAAAQQAQQALEDAEEIVGGNYVTQSEFGDVLSGASKVGAAAAADTASEAENVTGRIAGKQIGAIFESDGVTAKAATKAAKDGSGNDIAATYVKKTNLVDLVYPVGSVYINYADSSSPAPVLGGSWTQISSGQFLLASGSGFALGSTGGEEEHVLTQNEMPSHGHNTNTRVRWASPAEGNALNSTWASSTGNLVINSSDIYTSNTGGSLAHNNMPPYRAVSMWRRTA